MLGYWACTICSGGWPGDPDEDDICTSCGSAVEFFASRELAEHARKEAAAERGRLWAGQEVTHSVPVAEPPSVAVPLAGIPAQEPRLPPDESEHLVLLDAVSVGILKLLADEQRRSASAIERELKDPGKTDRRTIALRLKALETQGLVEGNHIKGPHAAWWITTKGKKRAHLGH